jgi:hypothetical protein
MWAEGTGKPVADVTVNQGHSRRPTQTVMLLHTMVCYSRVRGGTQGTPLGLQPWPECLSTRRRSVAARSRSNLRCNMHATDQGNKESLLNPVLARPHPGTRLSFPWSHTAHLSPSQTMAIHSSSAAETRCRGRHSTPPYLFLYWSLQLSVFRIPSDGGKASAGWGSSCSMQQTFPASKVGKEQVHVTSTEDV